MLGKTEGKRRRGRQKMRRLDGITDSMDMSLNKLREVINEGQRSLACCSQLMGLQRVRHDSMTEEQQSSLLRTHPVSTESVVEYSSTLPALLCPEFEKPLE